MNCYKCNTAEQLSIKKRAKDGTVRYWICKACRRADYHEYTPKSPEPEVKPDIDWVKLAKESHARVLARFA